MSKEYALSQIHQLSQQLSDRTDEYSGVIGSVQATIVDHFGQNGLIASYFILAVLILVIVSRLAKITFSTLKYLVLPALALAFLGSMITTYSFVALLPVTVTVCSLFLLFKG